MFGVTVGTTVLTKSWAIWESNPNSETKGNSLEEQHKAIYSFNIVSKDKLYLFFFLE